MNFLFGNPSSQASQNQETPFFEHPATRVSLFDNPPPSQSAFNLFNNEIDREKSLISQLEIFEREDEEKNEVMRKSRMGETINKQRQPRRQLFQSRTRDDAARKRMSGAIEKGSVSKDRLSYRSKESANFSFMGGQNSKFTEPESFNAPLRESRIQSDVNSNFQHYRRDQQKREEKKEELKQPKQKEVMKEIKQAREAKQTKVANEMKNMKGRDTNNLKVEVKEKKIEQDSSFKIEQNNPASKKSAFEFNLKRSKVQQVDKTEAKPEANSRLTFGFTLKRSRAVQQSKFNQPTSKPIKDNLPKHPYQQPSIETKPQQFQSKTSLQNRFETFDKKFFDIKIKQHDDSSVLHNPNISVSRVKEISVQDHQKIGKEPTQKRIETKEDNVKEVKQMKQIKAVKQIKQAKQVKQAKDIEKIKQQPLGLKEKLKTFATKPTQKLEIKSIMNKGFQFKTRLTLPREQQKTHDMSDVPTPTKCEQTPSTPYPQLSISLTPPTRTGKDSKQLSDIITISKPVRQSDFSKYMLQVMQLMQQEETLKSRCNAVKSTYREIAMIANNINSKIAKVTR